MVLILFSYFHIKNDINDKPSPWKTIFLHLMPSGAKTIDLRSNLIEKRYRGMKRAPKYFPRILPSYRTLRNNRDCLRKNAIFSKFELCHLWWHQFWPELKKIFVKVWDLVAVYLIPFTACRKYRSIRDWRGFLKPPPPPRHKLNILAPANNGVKLESM